MNACGDGVHVGRNRPCFQLLPMGDVPTATQLSNADMEWLDFAWYLGIEESEYVDLMYHLQHSRGADIFNIFQHEDLDYDDNLDDIDNVRYIADDEDDLSDIEEEPGPGGEIGFNQDLDDDVMDGGSDERSRDLGLDFEEGANQRVGWWSEFDDTDADSDVNDAAVEDRLPGNATGGDPGDGRIDEHTRGDGHDAEDGPNSGGSSNPSNADCGPQTCPGSDTAVAEEEPLPCSSRKRSREMDEQEPEAGCSKRFRWCSEFDEQDSDGSSDHVSSGGFGDLNSASCQNSSDRNAGSDAEEESGKRSREENEGSGKRLRRMNESETESAESAAVVEEDPPASGVVVFEELPAPFEATSRKHERDSDARRSKLLKCCDQFVDSDGGGDALHANVLHGADLCNSPTPSDAAVAEEEQPASAPSQKRSRERNEGSNKRFRCLIDFNDSDSDGDTGSIYSAGNMENADSGINGSDGNTLCDDLNADHTYSRSSRDPNSSRPGSSGNGSNTREYPSAAVAEKEPPTEDGEGSNGRFRWLIEFDVADSDGHVESVYSAAVAEEDPALGYTYSRLYDPRGDGLSMDHASSRASCDPSSSGADDDDDHPFIKTVSKAVVAEDEPLPALAWKRSRAEDGDSDAMGSKRFRWCNEFDDQDGDGSTDAAYSECSNNADCGLGRYNKNCQNRSLGNAGFDAVFTEEKLLPSATRKRSRERDEQDSEASSSKRFRLCHELDDGVANDGHHSEPNSQHGPGRNAGFDCAEENPCLAHPGKRQEGIKEPFRLSCWNCRGKASAKSNPNEIKKAD